MRKEVISSLLIAGLATGLQAGGDIGGVVSLENEIAPVEVTAPVVVAPTPAPAPKAVEPKVEKKAHSDFYMVAKGLYITGDEQNGHDADSGYGAGLDFGYRLGYGLSTELGVGFAKNTFDHNGGEKEASFKTGSLSLVYTYELAENIAIFAKGGYLYENEKIKGLNVDEDESGFAFGGGLEYMLNDTYGVVAEYETSTIDSIRGDAVSLGLMVNF
jgi:opacity protein-like surface antigen